MEETILAAANPAQRKYYQHPLLNGLPEDLQQELKALCASGAERIGATFIVLLDAEGQVDLRTMADDALALDEIGAALVIKETLRRHGALLKGLALYFAAKNPIL